MSATELRFQNPTGVPWKNISTYDCPPGGMVAVKGVSRNSEGEWFIEGGRAASETDAFVINGGHPVPADGWGYLIRSDFFFVIHDGAEALEIGNTLGPKVDSFHAKKSESGVEVIESLETPTGVDYALCKMKAGSGASRWRNKVWNPYYRGDNYGWSIYPPGFDGNFSRHEIVPIMWSSHNTGPYISQSTIGLGCRAVPSWAPSPNLPSSTGHSGTFPGRWFDLTEDPPVYEFDEEGFRNDYTFCIYHPILWSTTPPSSACTASWFPYTMDWGVLQEYTPVIDRIVTPHEAFIPEPNFDIPPTYPVAMMGDICTAKVKINSMEHGYCDLAYDSRNRHVYLESCIHGRAKIVSWPPTSPLAGSSTAFCGYGIDNNAQGTHWLKIQIGHTWNNATWSGITLERITPANHGLVEMDNFHWFEPTPPTTGTSSFCYGHRRELVSAWLRTPHGTVSSDGIPPGTRVTVTLDMETMQSWDLAELDYQHVSDLQIPDNDPPFNLITLIDPWTGQPRKRPHQFFRIVDAVCTEAP